MKTIDAAFDKLFPSNEALWSRAGAEMQVRTIEPGRQEMVPFFDLEIDDVFQARENSFGPRMRKIGHTLVYRVMLTDGIDREVHVHLPDEHIGSDFVVTDGAAWTTKNDGYAKHRARKIVESVRVPVIQIGAEHSATKIDSLRSVVSLAKTARQSMTISLAKTAQSEELILAYFMEKFQLPRQQYAIGDSRAAMKSPGQHVYAREYGNEVVYLDTKAPCVPDKMTPDELDRFFRWIGTEALGGVAVGLAMAKSGELHTLLRSTSLQPHFVLSSLVGIMPALAAGSDMAHLVPKDANGQIVVYDRDGLTYADRWIELFREHRNMAIKRVPHGIHASLLNPAAHGLQIERIGRFSDVYGYYDGDDTRFDDADRQYILRGITDIPVMDDAA